MWVGEEIPKPLMEDLAAAEKIRQGKCDPNWSASEWFKAQPITAPLPPAIEVDCAINPKKILNGKVCCIYHSMGCPRVRIARRCEEESLSEYSNIAALFRGEIDFNWNATILQERERQATGGEACSEFKDQDPTKISKCLPVREVNCGGRPVQRTLRFGMWMLCCRDHQVMGCPGLNTQIKKNKQDTAITR